MSSIDLVWSGRADAGAGAGTEADAFAAAVRRLQPGVTMLVWRLLGWSAQGAEVEDVVQEVFLAAWTHRARLRDDAAFAGWLRAIAVRRTRNHVRARARRQRWLSLCGFGPGEEPVGTPAESEDGRLRRAMGRLRHADRELLVLRYLEGLEVTDLTAALQLGRAAVDARLSRARRRLDAALRLEDRR